jgi:hypothetical protein
MGTLRTGQAHQLQLLGLFPFQGRVGDSVMVKPENQVDKNRFEKRKAEAERSGKTEVKAIKKAAGSVKQQREAEGRPKNHYR